MSVHGEDCIDQFEVLTYQNKIEYILSKKLYKKNQDRVRMEGMTQSYNIDDSLAFNACKNVRLLLKDL